MLEKSWFESEFNQQTGEYESGEVKKEVEEQFYTLALGLENSEDFTEKLKPLSLFLNLKNGVYNFKESYFFKIKNDIIYIGTSLRSEQLFHGKTGKLSARQSLLAKGNSVAATFNSFEKLKDQNGDSIKGLKELNVKKRGVFNGYEETQFSLLFKKDHNAVIELTSFVIQLIK